MQPPLHTFLQTDSRHFQAQQTKHIVFIQLSIALLAGLLSANTFDEKFLYISILQAFSELSLLLKSRLVKNKTCGSSREH